MKKKIFYECRIIYFLRLTCASTPKSAAAAAQITAMTATLKAFTDFFAAVFVEVVAAGEALSADVAVAVFVPSASAVSSDGVIDDVAIHFLI